MAMMEPTTYNRRANIHGRCPRCSYVFAWPKGLGALADRPLCPRCRYQLKRTAIANMRPRPVIWKIEPRFLGRFKAAGEGRVEVATPARDLVAGDLLKIKGRHLVVTSTEARGELLRVFGFFPGRTPESRREAVECPIGCRLLVLRDRGEVAV